MFVNNDKVLDRLVDGKTLEPADAGGRSWAHIQVDLAVYKKQPVVIRLYDLVLVPNHEAGNSYWRNVGTPVGCFHASNSQTAVVVCSSLGVCPGKDGTHRQSISANDSLPSSIGLWIERTAGPSTTLRFGRDDKGEGGASIRIGLLDRENCGPLYYVSLRSESAT